MAGITQDVYEKQLKSFSSQMTILWNQIKAVGIEIGRLLAPSILALGEKIKSLIAAWNKLSDGMKKLIIGIGLFVAVLGPALIVMGVLIKLITAVGLVAVTTAGSLLLIVAALVAIKNAPSIGKYFYDEFKIVQQIASNFVLNIMTGWEYVRYGFKQMVAGMRMGWDAFASFLVESFAGTIRKIAEGFVALENMINKLPWVENVSLGAEKIEAWAKSLEGFAKRTGGAGKEMWEQNKADLEQQLAFLDELSIKIFKDIEANFAKVGEEAVIAAEEIVETTEEVASTMGDVIKDVGWRWHNLFEDWAGSALDTFGNLKRIAEDTMDGISESLTDMVMTGKANFNELANSILRDITRMIIKAQMAKVLMAFMPGLFPTQAAPIPVPIGHSGGIVGKMGPGRSVSAAVFANAPRFHDGLASDEVPTILQKGEMVLSKNDVSQLGKGSEGGGGGKGSSVNITVQAIDAQGTYQFLESNKRTIASMLQGTMRSNHPIRRFDK